MKRTILLTFLFILLNIVASAQTDEPIYLKSGECITLYDTTDNSRTTHCTFPDLEAYYPAGEGAWANFLRRKLVYPRIARWRNIEGTVMLCFKVCKDSSIHELQVMSGPKQLQRNALNLIKKVPQWAPAIVRGRRVDSYVNLPVVFRFKS